MSTEPYTPDEAELRDCYALVMDEHAGEDYDTAKADAERGIAKIKADALREAAGQFVGTGEVRDELESYLHGVADSIEGKDGPRCSYGCPNEADFIDSDGEPICMDCSEPTEEEA